MAGGVYGGALALGCVALLYLLRGMLAPVVLAFALAYLLDPAVDRLERVGVPRSAGIALLLVVALAALGLGLVLVLPAVIHDIAALVAELPPALNRLLETTQPWLAAHGLPLPRSGSEALAALAANVQQLMPDAVGVAQSAGRALLGSTASALGVVAAAVMVPVLSFHLLRDFDLIVAAVVELMPAGRREALVSMGRDVHAVLGHFVRGQLIVMAILAVLYAAGYSLVGVRLAIPIGLVAGLFSFIPYVGSALALALGLLMSVLHFSGWAPLAGVLLVYAVVQALEGFVITPRVVGGQLGLPAVWVLLALMAGAELFGFLGVMLALPAAAVVKVFVDRALRRYRESALYAGLPPEAPPRPARLRLRPRRGGTIRRGAAR